MSSNNIDRTGDFLRTKTLVAVQDSVNFSVSKDVEQSYDDAITAAIKRSLDDPEGLLQSMACKKRKRSSSFARADAVDSGAKEPTSPDTSCNDSPDSSGTPTVTFSSAAVNESKVNTPSKRSIRSMFQAVARKSTAPPTPSSSQSAGDSAGKPEEVTTLKSGVDLQNADLNESRNTGEDGTNSQLSTDRCDDGAGLPTKGNDENNVSDVAKRPRNSDHIPASLEEANPSNGAPVATGDQLHPAIEAVLEDEVNQVCAEKATADENDVKIVSVDLGDRKSPIASVSRVAAADELFFVEFDVCHDASPTSLSVSETQTRSQVEPGNATAEGTRGCYALNVEFLRLAINQLRESHSSNRDSHNFKLSCIPDQQRWLHPQISSAGCIPDQQRWLKTIWSCFFVFPHSFKKKEGEHCQISP